MGTDKVIFVGEQWGATGSHVTGRGHGQNRKYVMRMRNWKFRNTPSGAFSPQVTSVTGRDHDRKWSCVHAQPVHFVLLLE
jgi:hypothetical protein